MIPPSNDATSVNNTPNFITQRHEKLFIGNGLGSDSSRWGFSTLAPPNGWVNGLNFMSVT